MKTARIREVHLFLKPDLSPHPPSFLEAKGLGGSSRFFYIGPIYINKQK